MRTWKIGLAFPFLCMALPAWANCADQPPAVKDYLRAHPEWRMRVLEDLGDQKEWRELKGDACPGMTALDLDGKGRVYALLLQPRNNSNRSRVTIVGRAGWEKLLKEYYDGPAVEVLFRIPPGKYEDHLDFRSVTLEHDGLVIGNWNAGAMGWYLSGGRLKSYVASE